MTIPPYPSFRPIGSLDKNLFDEAFRNNPPEISEYTFTNLYSWRKVYDFEISRLDDFIILASKNGPGLPRFFDPIGKGDKKGAITKILQDCAATFVRIPEQTNALFTGEPGFISEDDQDNSDYLFRIEDLVRLAGRKYDGKRNLIKKFKSLYKYEYFKLSEANIKECLDFIETWCAVKDCDNIKSLNHEREAFFQILENFSSFGLIGGAIRIEGKICAVAIAERLNPDTLVMHILKAQSEYMGLYQTINQEFLASEAVGFEYLNMEQDLGLEGLRKAKLSYHPLKMIKKYTLRFMDL